MQITHLAAAEQLWMYGPICDGALAEIVQAKQQEKLVRYFGIVAWKDIVEFSLVTSNLKTISSINGIYCKNPE